MRLPQRTPAARHKAREAARSVAAARRQRVVSKIDRVSRELDETVAALDRVLSSPTFHQRHA